MQPSRKRKNLNRPAGRPSPSSLAKEFPSVLVHWPWPFLPVRPNMIHEAAIPEIITIKIGGSLFDLPRLGERLSTFLLELSPHLPVLVAGGGAIADHVREMDTRQGLGDEKAHWLALRAVTLNACFV